MDNSKLDRLLCVFCWLGVVFGMVVEGYLFRVAFAIPEIGADLRRYQILAGILLALWLAAAVYFTVQAIRQAKKK